MPQGSPRLRKLQRSQAHKIDNPVRQSDGLVPWRACKSATSLRDATAKTGQHALFESRIGFFLNESFFEDFVHSLGFLMSFSARGAFHQMSVKGAAFVFQKLAVKIGGEVIIDFVVNGCHMF